MSCSIHQSQILLFFVTAPSTFDTTALRYADVNDVINFILGRTVLVIAHRLSTVRNADVIGVVSNGRIVEVCFTNEHFITPKGSTTHNKIQPFYNELLACGQQ